jgi:hypothetical protein
VRTRYVVFIDNDAVPAPGWLPPLVECAETTGAWVVGPLYFIGEPERQEIHMAAGDARIEDRPGGRRFVERHRFAGKHPAEVREHLVRQPCEHVEFHCMLVRTEVFERLGPLDEELKSVAEHTDLCMLVRQGGGEVYFEPGSEVTYITSGGFTAADYAYFFRRWSHAWNQSSIDRFREKWQLPPARRGWRRWPSGRSATGRYPCGPCSACSSGGWARDGAAGRPGRCSASSAGSITGGSRDRAARPDRPRPIPSAWSPERAVFPYAQTNLQLYRQLAAEGYDAADVETVGRAHEVGLRLFPGTYRGSGKPFLAHLVGTASVLVSLRARVPVVVTGLLHAVYTHGEFGNGWPGMTDVRRAKIRSEVGEEIEDLIARYTRLTWKRSTIPRIRAGLDGMGPVERDVLLVRLANELEDHLDLGILYLDNHADRREFMEADLPATVEMAERSAFPPSPRASPRPSRRSRALT